MQKKKSKGRSSDKALLKRRVKESEKKIRKCEKQIRDANAAKKKAMASYTENVNALLDAIPDAKQKKVMRVRTQAKDSKRIIN